MKEKKSGQLRIAMLGHKRIPSREGGIEIVVEELSTRMVELGHAVTCYNRKGHHVSGVEFDGEERSEYKGVRLKTVPTIERNTEYDQDSISYTKLDDIIYFIKSYCKENGIKNISVQAWGGEPLLEKDKILYMVNKLKMKNTKVHFSIETNATLLTNNNILSMYESHVGLGISIDGGMNIHNKQRKFISGKDTYDIVINNMQETKNIYNNRIGTITTITRESAKKIESVIDNIVIDLGINNIKMNFVHLSNYRNCNDICLAPKEIAETELRIFRKIIELQEMGYSVIEQNIMAKLKNILFRKYTDVCLSCGCCGGRKMIVFDMHGNIFPCELTDQPEYAIGNIYNGIPLISQIENSIKEIGRAHV